MGARQGSPGTRPVRAPRTSPTAAMSTARSSLEDMLLSTLAPTFFAVRASCRLPHFVLGRSGIDSLPGTLPRLRRGTLPAKSQEPALRGKALCALIRTARYSSAEVSSTAFPTPLPRASRTARQWPALHSGHRLAQYGIAELHSAMVCVWPRRSGRLLVCVAATPVSAELQEPCGLLALAG